MESLAEINGNSLIEEVRKRPELYDKKVPGYNDKVLKRTAWENVCQTLLNNWNELKPRDRQIKCIEFQRRWKNIRDCFRRELHQQRKESQHPWIKKRRRYVYFKQLRFLLSSCAHEMVRSVPLETMVDDFGHSTSDVDMSQDDPPTERIDCNDVKLANEAIFLPESRHRNGIDEEFGDEHDVVSFINSRNETNSRLQIAKNENDEDTLFLLSLVPSFKRLDERQKLVAKIEFLNVIKRITYDQ